jgi:ribulose-5-phosphate 4-epimerase/fuculose-1-phosphate aldolase
LCSGGNISARLPGEEIVAITPAGRSYSTLDLNDICVLDFNRNAVEGSLGNACHCYFIQNHGALCLGADMKRAMKNAELLENVSRIYCQALATGQPIQELPPSALEYFADMRRLRFK